MRDQAVQQQQETDAQKKPRNSGQPGRCLLYTSYLLANEKMDGKLFEYMCKNGGQLPPKEEPVVISAQEGQQQATDAIMDLSLIHI